jgi:NAD(P)-dependent dehydrogenase (short-subunit alcohol dehydrogenase family)
MANSDGKVVFITGAAGGLGTALAHNFAKEGYRLFLSDKNDTRLREVIDELAGTGSVVAGEPMDLADTSAAREIVEQAFRTYGRIDVLINNAGVSQAKSFWELTEKDWDLVLDVNVKALFFVLQATAKHMLQRGGSIVNVASVAGRLPRPKLMHYAASKAAVISITQSAALALAGNNIRVNAVAPGMMDTEMLQMLLSDFQRASDGSTAGQPDVSVVPLGRIARPQEVAAAVLYLASDAAAYITGQTLNVCGGISMS